MSILPFSTNPLRTREELQRLVCDLVEPVTPHFSPGSAQVRLGENRAHYGDPASGLEGFARPLWGLLPLAAGGGQWKQWPLWLRGIMAGTDPAHAEFWGWPRDYDQRSVEQAAFGFGLALAPEAIWEPLDPASRERFSAWLQRINRVQLVHNNWLFFRVLVNLGLRRCGQPWSAKTLEADLAALESFHLGGGWYSDGKPGAHGRDGRTGDYYVPMGFQFYGLVYARLASGDDPERAALFRERACLFARDFQHWFAADGAALPFGRSLAYRFAQGAFWGALAFADVEALPWPVIKGLYLRHLRWWLRQPIFSETGLLTVGYTYPNLLMAESYNGPGSPYWALKTFLPLALPAEHPFWQAEEAPLPPRPAVHTVPGAKLILTTQPLARDITAINPGQPTLDWPRHAPHKYSKCAYSTRFGFAVPASMATPTEGGLDNNLSLSDDGRFFRTREQCFDAEVDEGVAYSRWQPWPDVEVQTWLLAQAGCHVRLHRIRSARKLWALEAGFAACWTDRQTLHAEPGKVSTPMGVSVLRDLSGGREGGTVDLGTNSHLLASLATMPVLRSTHEPGEWHLACVVEGQPGTGAEPMELSGFSVEVDGNACHVFYHGEPWWTSDGTPSGTSSPRRLEELNQLA